MRSRKSAGVSIPLACAYRFSVTSIDLQQSRDLASASWRPSNYSPHRQRKPQERPRKPPDNLEAEQALLGAILINNDAFDRVSDFLRSEHFVEEIHRRIFEIAGSLIRAGKLATPVTLKTFLGDHDLGGVTVPQYLARLVSEATTIINAHDYGRSVHDLAIRRELISIGEDVVNVAFDAPVDSSPREQIEDAERRLYQIAETGRYDGGFQRFSDALKLAVDMAAAAYERDGSLSGIATGLTRSRPLDGRPASVRPRHPRRPPGHGQDGARHQHRLQRREGLSGGERSADGATKRSMAASSASSRSKCPPSNSRPASSPNSPASPPPRSVAATSPRATSIGSPMRCATCSQIPFYIDQTGGLSIAQLDRPRAPAEAPEGLDLLVVDYLQLLSARRRTKTACRN